MIPRVIIGALCAIGLYSSVFMYRKSLRAERGLLSEPSVVQSARARAVGGLPNALLGIVFYAALALFAFFGHGRSMWLAALAASCGAAAMSIYLAYSLLFVTKMPCAFCWTSHAINFLLAALLFLYRQW